MADALTLVIPLVLHTANRGRGGHWATRHKLTKVWEKEIWAAVYTTPGAKTWILARSAPERRRLTITRWCRSRASLIKDSDNRMFAGKGIRDALVRLELLSDDSDEWLESAVYDVLSAEPKDCTTIRIERL